MGGEAAASQATMLAWRVWKWVDLFVRPRKLFPMSRTLGMGMGLWGEGWKKRRRSNGAVAGHFGGILFHHRNF